jgi:SAM-dependent methyltransferase
MPYPCGVQKYAPVTSRPLPPASRAGWRWRLAQALERRWWRRYLRGKDPAAYRAWKAAYWNDLLARHAAEFGLDRPQDLLDAGCGPAGVNLVLPDHAAHRVTALDPLLDRYRELPAWPALERPEVRYVTGPLEGAPERLGTAAFDGVLCLNAINHVDDLGAALDALGRLTRPGGWLLLGVDAHTAGWRKRLFRLLPGDALHPHQHDADEYVRLLEARGWTVAARAVHRPGRWFDYVLLGARR